MTDGMPEVYSPVLDGEVLETDRDYLAVIMRPPA